MPGHHKISCALHPHKVVPGKQTLHPFWALGIRGVLLLISFHADMSVMRMLIGRFLECTG